jgi:DNA-directed RNA polymerase subunit M/transcription elongation factor TFIIS
MNNPLFVPNPANGEKVTCDKCGHDKFQLGFILEKYSKIIMAADKDQISPLQVFACMKCGHVNDYFLPKDYSNTVEETTEDTKE